MAWRTEGARENVSQHGWWARQSRCEFELLCGANKGEWGGGNRRTNVQDKRGAALGGALSLV